MNNFTREWKLRQLSEEYRYRWIVGKKIYFASLEAAKGNVEGALDLLLEALEMAHGRQEELT